MPRAKVKPEDRQRLEHACQPCQSSKKKCDGKSPCGLCVKHERQHLCILVAGARRGSKATPYPTPRLRNATPSSSSTSFVAGAARSESAHVPIEKATSPIIDRTGGQYTTNQMMLNSKGEKVFLGETASLSFLQFLRQILRQHVGPSKFTENSANVMLEAQSPEASPTELHDHPDLQRNFIQYYLAATSGLMSLHSQSNVDLLVSRATILDRNLRLEQAESLVAMAIGAQARNRASDSGYAQAYFERGRQLAFEGHLESPGLQLVRIFLLMTFYMLGACQRNTACLYLGIASQTASILGLHDESQYRNGLDSEQTSRLRTWRSLNVMDTLVNTLLGRPTSLPSARSTSFAQTACHAPTDASYQLCVMIKEHTSGANDRRRTSLPTAESQLQAVRARMRSFPSEYRAIKIPDLSTLKPDELASMLCNVHLACIYYFAVILISRPFLMATISSRMKSTGSTPLVAMTTSESAQMAETCIDAAIFLANMAKSALDAGILLANMAILKAWIFLAGLVLGFSICTQVDERTDVETAFAGAREVLAMLAVSSPQAREYHDILGFFAEAIRHYREKAAQRRLHNSKRYVDEVLSFHVHDEGPPAQNYISPVSGSLDSSVPGLMQLEALADFSMDSDPSLGNNTDFGDLGQFATQINDFFPFDYDSLGFGYD